MLAMSASLNTGHFFPVLGTGVGNCEGWLHAAITKPTPLGLERSAVQKKV